jgi:hypothetical protein
MANYYARDEISLNNIIVFRKPTHSYHSEASEFGTGGYNFISGNRHGDSSSQLTVIYEQL